MEKGENKERESTTKTKPEWTKEGVGREGSMPPPDGPWDHGDDRELVKPGWGIPSTDELGRTRARRYYPRLHKRLVLFVERWVRKAHRMTMRELAHELEMSTTTLAKYLAGCTLHFYVAERISLRLGQLNEGFLQGWKYPSRLNRVRRKSKPFMSEGFAGDLEPNPHILPPEKHLPSFSSEDWQAWLSGQKARILKRPGTNKWSDMTYGDEPTKREITRRKRRKRGPEST